MTVCNNFCGALTTWDQQTIFFMLSIVIQPFAVTAWLVRFLTATTCFIFTVLYITLRHAGKNSLSQKTKHAVFGHGHSNTQQTPCIPLWHTQQSLMMSSKTTKWYCMFSHTDTSMLKKKQLCLVSVCLLSFLPVLLWFVWNVGQYWL